MSVQQIPPELFRPPSERFSVNRSLEFRTTVVCALTSNLALASSPGNVLLNRGEANLPKASVVNVSQLYTVDKADLVEKIGTLAEPRLRDVLDGLYFLLGPRDVELEASSPQSWTHRAIGGS